MKSSAIFGVLVVFLLSSPVMAEVYQYVDANGKMVFSDQPPPGAKAKPLNVHASHAAQAASAPAAKGSKGMAADVDNLNAKIDAQNAKTKAANLKIKQDNCKRAQENLASLQQNGRIRVPGSNGLATDDQRSAMIQQAQQDVQSWCN